MPTFGIIPAYAGNTRLPRRSCAGLWDHPAYAGNTRCRTGFQAGCGDHPRVCGEHQLDALVGGIRTGSSPRMRGTLAPVIIGHVAHGIIPAYAGTPLVVWGDSCDEGIIPAYAGNTPRAAWTPRSCRDHPRVCGEHVSCELDGFAVQGSSPRMRGTPTNDYDFDTPRRDHPRVCGEHVPAIAPTAPPTGSSPRMRGTRSVGRAVRGGLGIIPAYAGNTSSAWLCMIRIRDHPRVCGEHLSRLPWASTLMGSSPRMRGTH